jgi:Protein of unknown function (DUF3575)
MKKLLLVAALGVAGVASAQENSIKVNPLSLLGGNDLLSYEHKIDANSSAAVGVGYSSMSVGTLTYSNMGAELQYRFYFGEAIRGWYAGPAVGYTSGKLKDEGTTAGMTLSEVMSGKTTTNRTTELNYSRFQLGARGGYQWVWASGFTLDLNAGIAYNSIKYSGDTAGFPTVKASGIFPNFGLGLGYSF